MNTDRRIAIREITRIYQGMHGQGTTELSKSDILRVEQAFGDSDRS